MHRALKISLSLLLTLPPLACGLLLALAASEGGSRLLAEQARRWSGGALEWGDMQGRLLGPLRLEDLNIRSPGLQLEVQLSESRPYEQQTVLLRLRVSHSPAVTTLDVEPVHAGDFTLEPLAGPPRTNASTPSMMTRSG